MRPRRNQFLKGGLAAVLAALLGVLMAGKAALADAPTTAPAADSSVIVRHAEAAQAAATSSSSSSEPSATSLVTNVGGGGSMLRVGMALAGVVGLILILKYGAGTMLGVKAAGPRANKGVRVLSRTTMGPRQQLVLLQVGRKLVLVADSGGTVSTVTEIVDPDEVAELAGQAIGAGPGAGVTDRGGELGDERLRERASVIGGGQPFGKLFKRQSLSYDGSSSDGALSGGSSVSDREEFVEPRAESVGRETSGEAADDENVDLAGLAERVRRLNRQFN